MRTALIVIASLLLPALQASAGLRVMSLQSGSITLAWDPMIEDAGVTVTGFVISYGHGNECGNWTGTTVVGKVTTATIPLDTSKPWCFAIQAVMNDLSLGNGILSLYSDVVITTAVSTPPPPPPPVTDTCAAPLGTKAVQLFAGRVAGTTGSIGSRANLQFQIASPAAPVIQLWIYNGQETSPAMKGTELVDVGSMWFRAPTTPGTYSVVLNAINAAGCSATLTKGADGKPLTITVK